MAWLILFSLLQEKTQVFSGNEEARREAETRLRSRVNLAQYALETLVEGEPALENSRRLHDANLDSYLTRPATTYTLTLAEGRRASLDGVGIYGWPYKNRVIVEGIVAPGEFRKIGEVDAQAGSTACFILVEFEPILLAGIRVRIDGDHYCGEIAIFEAAGKGEIDSVLSQGGFNIAHRFLGGCLFYLPSGVGDAAALYDDDPNTRARLRGQEAIPLVFSFLGNQEALVRGVSVRTTAENPPAKVRLFASRDDPFEGFRLLGEFPVAEREGEQLFELPSVERARFLKVELAPQPDRKQVEVAELAIREGSENGYASVMLRGRSLRQWREAGTTSLDSLIPGVTPVPEAEPNDDLGVAQGMAFDQWTNGSLRPLTDRDLFRVAIPEHSEEEKLPVLDLHMVPFLRGRVRILDAKGNPLLSLPIGSGTSVRHPLPIPAGEYVVEIVSTKTHVLLAYDTSGSMTKTVPTTNEAIASWADRLSPGFFVASAVTIRDSVAKRRFTLLCPFTSDPAQIKASPIDWSKHGGGGDDWFDLIPEFLGYLENEVPAEETAALVYTSDGNGFGNFHAMWEALRRTRVRLYTIGFGDVGAMIDSQTGWDGGRGLFNIAWVRSGRYYEPREVKQVAESYDRIFEDLSRPPEYALRMSFQTRGRGTLVSKAPPRENRPLHFILDASGSMLAKAGEKTRLQAAKDTIARILESVPLGDAVGLRVYGHRFPSTDPVRAATDSELLIPIGPLKREAFLRSLNGVRARGGTPLAYSIRQAVGDLRGVEKPRVVLITDGVDSFRGNAVESARALASSIRGMEFRVVGFGIGPSTDQASLKKMAEAAKGTYSDATDVASFVRAMEEALQSSLPYTVLDGTGRAVAQGRFGQRQVLLEGTYTCVFSFAGREHRAAIRILPDRESVLELPKP